MIKSLLPSLFLLFLFSSCSENKNQIPNNIIGKEKMIQILSDLCLMEGAINIAKQPIPNVKPLTTNFNVFKEHSITRQQFDSSLMYYCNHMDEFREIQSSVLEELNKKK